MTCLDWLDDAEELLEQYYSGDVLVYSQPPTVPPATVPYAVVTGELLVAIKKTKGE